MNLDNEYIFDGSFGIERETLRVNKYGHLAQTPHPFPDNKYLDKDFCENQLELITPVCGSIDSLLKTLTALDKEAKDKLSRQGEYLWLYSNPPHFETTDDIPIAMFSDDKLFKRNYRLNLEKRYGKRLMLYSGIHFNFSFSDKLLHSLCQGTNYKKFKTELYFRMSKQICRYSWLIVLLTASSPVYDISLDTDHGYGDGFDGYASRRNSDKGYWNNFIPVLDYSNLYTYINSIKNYIKNGVLFSAGELYLPIRLKPSGSNSLEAMEENGVNHIELRMFDVNPIAPLGIFRKDIEFAHYFLLYLLSLPDFEFTPALQKSAVENHRAAAKYDIENMKINGYNAVDAALGMLTDMEIHFTSFPRIKENIYLQKRKLTENKRYCVEIYNKFGHDYNKTMLTAIKNRKINY